MCGIAGVFALSGALDASRAEAALRAAVDAIAYRGPDACAVRVWPQYGLGLGHRRLSIIDLSDRANQPMGSPDGKVWISYNGEIYNFKEVRAALEAAGRRFLTSSDTEVLIEGYREWGLEPLLRRCAGMFAFALYDADSSKLFLARDRAGKKPLFYAERAGKLSFCSEARGLLRLHDGPRAPCREGMQAYLSMKFAPAPLTLFEGVRKVRPGHFLEASASGLRERSYWDPLGGPAVADRLEDRVDAALTAAARRRLVADVPVSVFLSGGVDSSLLVAKLAEAGARGTATYTIGYDDLPGYSEFDYSRRIAEKFPIDYREVVVGSADALGALQDDSLNPDEPIADWVWVPLHFISKRARADGFKVVLLGEGSDELFFGYDVMLKGLRSLERWRRPLWRLAAATGYLAGAPVYRLARRGHRRYDLWRRAAKGLPVYQGSSSGFAVTQLPQVAGPALGWAGADPAGDFVAGLCERFSKGARPDDLVNLVCFIEFHTKMGEILLPRVDRVTMRHSLEARAPFLDHELCELAFSIPGELKIPGRRLKGLLKEVALRHVPRQVVERPKMGFSFPFKEWLRGPLGPAVESAFAKSRLFRDGWVDGAFCRRMLAQHRRGWVDHAPRLWMLYSLCRWYDGWIA